MDLTFESWSGMGQPAINFTPSSFSPANLSWSDVGKAGLSLVTGNPFGAAGTLGAGMYSPASYNMGGIPVNPVSPGQSGVSTGGDAGSGVTFSGGTEPGVFYGSDGKSILRDEGGGSFRDLNTGRTLTLAEVQAMGKAGGTALQGTGEGSLQPVRGPQSFSADNPLIPVNTEPYAFSAATDKSGGGFGMPNAFYEARAKRAEAFLKSATDLEAQAAQFDFAPLAKARLAAFQEEELALERRAAEAVGTVADQLSRRRVLGASFSDRQILDTQRTFEQAQKDLSVKKAEMMAASTLEEMGIKTDLLSKANALRVQAFDEDIKNTIQDSAIQAEMSRTFSTLSEANMRTRMLIAAQEAQSIRSSIFGAQNSANQTAAFTAAQEAAREQRTSLGIGNLIGGILGAPQAGGGSFIGNLLDGLF